MPRLIWVFWKQKEAMITKERVMDSLKSMPDRFSIDELIDKLLFIEKVEKGLAQSDRGEVFSQEQAREMLKKWSE
ncbi:MAG TPA: hypothetical protein VF646_07990 [Cytophagales bacterium]